MVRKRIITFDEEIDSHLTKVMGNLRALGIKNISKPDALRFIIQMNQEAEIKYKRKPKSKKGVVFY